jgi:hypothetical protein
MLQSTTNGTTESISLANFIRRTCTSHGLISWSHSLVPLSWSDAQLSPSAAAVLGSVEGTTGSKADATEIQNLHTHTQLVHIFEFWSSLLQIKLIKSYVNTFIYFNCGKIHLNLTNVGRASRNCSETQYWHAVKITISSLEKIYLKYNQIYRKTINYNFNW